MDNLSYRFISNYNYWMGKYKKTKKTKYKKTKKKKKKLCKLSISEKKYKQLIKQRKSKKKMTSKHKKQLDDALYVKYCKCLKKFEVSGEKSKGYPICMNSVYKHRKFTPPKNASTNCSLVFNKNI